MNQLIEEIARKIREFVQHFSIAEDGRASEMRSVFHGPPRELLEDVFRCLTTGAGLQVEEVATGVMLDVPVLLQVDRLPVGQRNPEISRSGLCDESHLLTLRNSPDCPRYVALVPPGQHRNLSVSSASNEFGLSADNNSGNATIDDWWADDFVQELVAVALKRGRWSSVAEGEDATLLVRAAIRAADQVDRHDVARRGAWNVLSRVFSITNDAPFGTSLSFACGFPPLADGSVSPTQQIEVLDELADALVLNGFKPGLDRFKEKASEEDIVALDDLLVHLRSTCEISTAFSMAAAHFYAPVAGGVIAKAPFWWMHLTLEKWLQLFDEGGDEVDSSISMECVNALFPARKGMPPIVLDRAEIRVSLQNSDAPPPILITREIGPVPERETWRPDLTGMLSVDESIPAHKTPLRYSASAARYSRATIRIISLASWEAAVVISCQSARKVSLPKAVKKNRDQIALEANLSLAGLGRHYIDLYVRPGVIVASATLSSELSVAGIEQKEEPVAQISEHAFGFEVDVNSDCYCDIQIDRGNGPERLRIHLEPKETATEGCSSEFERLIKLNSRADRGRAINAIHINRQHRISDLQTWLLESSSIEISYLPLVIGSDYSAAWRTPNWASGNTSLSRAGYLHDPRPSPEDISPPIDFVEARRQIAEIIRGEDGNGLVEIARLGEWLVARPGFEELIEKYLSSYSAWLEAEPDTAMWADIILIASTERDGRTLISEPDALILSPLHPIRLSWQCLAQKLLFQAIQAHRPCPAASILDPSRVPDLLSLPMRTAAGGIRRQQFISIECSSDYWGIYWNGDRLGALATRATEAPFDNEFGLRTGGASSGFSVAQVERALNDISELLAAKPVLSVIISSSAGASNSCDEGLLQWSRSNFGSSEGDSFALGTRLLQIFDDRSPKSRPEEATLSNLAEDTGNSVRWFSRLTTGTKPDLGIIAQLESSSPALEPIDIGSALSVGGLIRHRIRRQLPAQNGAFLIESRTGIAGPPSGDGLADKLMTSMARIESSDRKTGYAFAPNIYAIQDMLKTKNADFVAISSSAVDPACFLGRWLNDAYLWDYNLPSYSQRAGDNNGYYLLSQVKDLDRDTLKAVLSRLPGDPLDDEATEQLILEVSRRGIPTVRGLSSGDSGASGDLGLLLAARLLQDEFRPDEQPGSILPLLSSSEEGEVVALIIPVDPFLGYLNDLQNGQTALRPDFLVAGLTISSSTIRCHLTPVEVKYRNGWVMSAPQSKEALAQASALSNLFSELLLLADAPGLQIWNLAFQHLLVAMLSYGFRVYSQQQLASERSRIWSSLHERVVSAILSSEIDISIDPIGRLIVADASSTSHPSDVDGDGFYETIVVSPLDAAQIAKGDPARVYETIVKRVGDWRLLPRKIEQKTLIEELKPGNSSPHDGRIEVAGQGSLPEATMPPSRSDKTESASADVEVKGTEEIKVELTLAGPQKATGIMLHLGETVDAFERAQEYLNISNTELNQLNIGVVGDLGTGKTQLLKSIIYQISQGKEQNEGISPNVLIFDYKKDYSAEEFVSVVKARVIPPYNLPLNLFDISNAGEDPNAWLRRYQFFSDVLDKIFSGIGPVQRQLLKQAVRAAYADQQQIGAQPTIYDVHAQYKILVGQRVDSVFSILDDLVDMQIFAREPEPGSFGRFFDGVVVIELNALGQDDRTKNMLVAVMLNMFYEHMLKIPKRPYRGKSPQLRIVDSFLLVDEADNIMRYEFDVLRKILLQGREFGVGVILASQYLRHFKAGATDYREPLLTWFLHKVPNVTPQELGALGLTADVAALAERIKTLPNHNCLFKTVGASGQVIDGLPFYKLKGIDRSA